MKEYVVDASVVLKWYFPGEDGVEHSVALLRDFFAEKVALFAPSLIDFEVINAVAIAVRGGKLSITDATGVIETFLRVAIGKKDISTYWPRILSLGKEFGVTAYDASYLALADSMQCAFLTADKKLLKSVGRKLKWVLSIVDYPLLVKLK